MFKIVIILHLFICHELYSTVGNTKYSWYKTLQ